MNIVLPTPSTAATTAMNQYGRCSTTKPSAKQARAAARTPSDTIIKARRRQRSAATPAGMAKTAIGATRAKDTMPAFTAECVRASTRSGYAIDVTCVPASDSNCPAWRRTKLRLRRSGTGGTR